MVLETVSGVTVISKAVVHRLEQGARLCAALRCGNMAFEPATSAPCSPPPSLPIPARDASLGISNQIPLLNPPLETINDPA